MQKEFIPYNEALALKKLGFDEPCFAFYNGKFINFKIWDDNGKTYPQINPNMDIGKCVSAPTYSEAFKYFRENHNMSGEIGINVMEDDEYCYEIGDIKTRTTVNEDSYKTHEKAELECLKKLIEIVSKKAEV
jgi:hypothetical protein